MKKHLWEIILVVILATTISCNGHFRFFVDPFPGMPVVIQPMSPGDGYIWIGGEWFWNGRTYMWRDGYWTRPLHGHTWNPGHWKKSRSEGVDGIGLRDIGENKSEENICY